MSAENELFIATDLEQALKSGDVQACYEKLRLIPDGKPFKLGALLFELADPLTEEKELMLRSIAERREHGLVKVLDKIVMIDGYGGSIALDDIAEALYQVVDRAKPAVFSHTHWDTSVHPIPSYAAIGFGDIPLFEIFMGQYPLLECRAAFNNGSDVRSIAYRGKDK